MCDPVTASLAALGTFATSAAGVGTAVAAGGLLAGKSALDQRKAMKDQKAAQRANIAAQERTAANAAKAEANRTRTPNFNAIFDKNTIASGVGSTVLTGAGGVTNGLSLARNSLLGG
jgi:hypothetical protein